VFGRTAYNMAAPTTKHVRNNLLAKLLDTRVVDHPVEEYVTFAHMNHEPPVYEAEIPSVDVSIFFGSVC
jgi:hypothetical protein